MPEGTVNKSTRCHTKYGRLMIRIETFILLVLWYISYHLVCWSWQKLSTDLTEPAMSNNGQNFQATVLVELDAYN